MLTAELRNIIFWISLIGAIVSIFFVCINDYQDKDMKRSYVSTFLFSPMMIATL